MIVPSPRQRRVAGLAQAEIGVEAPEDRLAVQLQRDHADRRALLEDRADDERQGGFAPRVLLHVRQDGLDQRPRPPERPGQVRRPERARLQARADVQLRPVRDEQGPVGVEQVEIRVGLGVGERGQAGAHRLDGRPILVGRHLARLVEPVEPHRRLDEPRRVRQEQGVGLPLRDEFLELRGLRRREITINCWRTVSFGVAWRSRPSRSAEDAWDQGSGRTSPPAGWRCCSGRAGAIGGP